MLMWGKKVGNGKVFSRITCIFGAVKPPRSGPSETALFKESPGRGPAARRKFFRVTNVLSIFKKSFKYFQEHFKYFQKHFK